jgi:hypothetical protein
MWLEFELIKEVKMKNGGGVNFYWLLLLLLGSQEHLHCAQFVTLHIKIR